MEDLVRIREERVEGIGPWVWPINDSGAWIGPSEEFALIRDIILPNVKQRQYIFTAGGCCGMYPRLWSELFTTVYTAEPAPLNWYCLQKNCTGDNIKKYNVALGEFEKKSALKLGHDSNVGTNTIAEDENGSIAVDMISIDSLNMPGCDVIQLDIEGYEACALLGAFNTIAKFKPVISIESMAEQDASHVLLYSLGYRVFGKARNDTILVPI